MARPKESVRIGEAERAAAQRALQDHLNAGRLQVNEYADRSAAAAHAVTASELDALFTDLPGRRPKASGASGGGMRRSLVIGGVVVGLALAGLLALALVGGSRTAPAPSPAAAPTPAVIPPLASDPPSPSSIDTPTATAPDTPDESIGASATPLSGGGTVRRTTGGDLITLSRGYGVDLDDNASPNWNVNRGCCSRDVGWDSNGSKMYISNDYAVMAGSADYETCSHETGYTSGPLERGSIAAGENICVRTGGDRYALVTIAGVTDQSLQFRATVWDPPIS